MESTFPWPKDFAPVPDEDWAREPLQELAMKYDTVEEHGWYDNLDHTVAQVAEAHGEGDLLLDYSGGTGILTDRLFSALGQVGLGVLIADSSPKYLRLALEKFRNDPRVAFRLIRYIAAEKRLERLDECIQPSVLDRGVDAITSTNAIHLYYGLPDTLRSWFDILRPGGRIYVQSGNIRNPTAPDDAWIIDETVDHIHAAAITVAKKDDRFAEFRSVLDDGDYMDAHDVLRTKYFLPVRPLATYRTALVDAGFQIDSIEARPIEARVDDWYDFLAVYHEGVLGWAGGARKITGQDTSEDVIKLRKALMRAALGHIFEGRETFTAVWTYLVGSRPR